MGRRGSALIACVAVVGIGGCTGSSQAGSAPPAPASASATPTARPQQPQPDERACASVQASLAHLTASTAGWSPTLEPFDAAIAGLILQTSGDLTREAPTARSLAVRKVVAANAQSFHDLATAMTGKDRAEVARTVAGTKVSYRALTKVCRDQP